MAYSSWPDLRQERVEEEREREKEEEEDLDETETGGRAIHTSILGECLFFRPGNDCAERRNADCAE